MLVLRGMLAVLCSCCSCAALRGVARRAYPLRAPRTAARQSKFALARAVAGDVEAPAANVEAPVATGTTPVDVFIESTDCFQVVFYANYFKWFEYGLGAPLTAADGVKYRTPATLGDALVVETTPLADGGCEQVIAKADGTPLILAARTSTEAVAVPAPPAEAPEGAVRQHATHV